jgi:hypothetical protein
MKKLAPFFLFFFMCATSLSAQNYNSLYIHTSKHLATLDAFNNALDSVAANSINNVSFGKKLTSHWTYGFGYQSKVGLFELGGNLFWGNTNETFSFYRDTVNNVAKEYDWWIRQRLFGLNARAGLSLGRIFSLGADFGGLISNFQHIRTDHTKTPLWFFNYSGTRSFLGSVSPYIALVIPIEDASVIRIEPYATFTFGKTSFQGVFDKAIFHPNSDFPQTMNMRFYGLRVSFGFAWYK